MNSVVMIDFKGFDHSSVPQKIALRKCYMSGVRMEH